MFLKKHRRIQKKKSAIMYLLTEKHSTTYRILLKIKTNRNLNTNLALENIKQLLLFSFGGSALWLYFFKSEREEGRQRELTLSLKETQ